MHDGSRGQPVVDVIGRIGAAIEAPRELYETTNQPTEPIVPGTTECLLVGETFAVS